MKSRNMPAYAKLMRLDKPIGIFLLLYPTSWALVMANQGSIQLQYAVIFFLGVVATRSLGCVINDIADRNIDIHVLRTKDRPLATQEISILEATIIASGLTTFSVILLLQLPMTTWPLALVAMLLMIIYPFCKRFFHCPQLILGIAFSVSILMVYSTVCGTLTMEAWQIFTISTLWSVIYDTQYALVDKEDDLKLGLRSSAILFGKLCHQIIAILQKLFFCLWLNLGIKHNFNTQFYMFLSLAALLGIYQQYLIMTNIRENSFLAFQNNKWVGLLLLIGVAANFYF
ncbi:MAG: 4-hydroxybenzoate octaprenyltransferase [Pseudomonadota bacterium]|nr:4-hydroxybenzoate octaprenyltransferase [Pseudomonadota bacterium]